jgi:uncharacterized protein
MTEPEARLAAEPADTAATGRLPGAEHPTVPGPLSDRTTIRRHADRSVPDRIEEFLRAGLVAHVALVADGEPRLLPFSYHYEAGTIYIYGSPANATMTLALDGRTVAVAVTAIDGLVASKSASGHAVNYRSVVAFGHARPVEDLAEKRRVLEAMIERYFPGRETPRDYAPALEADIAATALTAIEIDEASAKVRDLMPNDPLDRDPGAPGTAFVVSLRPQGSPEPRDGSGS